MKTRPNIIFFFTDQQRADSCGCYGSPNGLTPHLDQLAEEGILYNNAFSPQPVCGPARAILQTGQYPTTNGCYRNDIPIDHTFGDAIAKCFKAAGYRTGYLGKWHLAGTITEPVTKELRCGYEDYWLASDILEFTSSAYEGYLYNEKDEKIVFEDQYRVDFMTDKLIDFVKENEGSRKPYFMFASYLEPHHQNAEHRYIGPKDINFKRSELDIPEDLLALDCLEADWQENIEDYFGCIKSLDNALGKLVTTLKETGQYEDTVIVFTSDHGSHFKTRNSEYKRSCHEASIKVPLIIGGGIAQNRVINTNVSLVDLPPTLLDIAGIEVPKSYEGESVLKIGDRQYRDVLIQISESEVGRAIRTDRYKYAVTAPHKDPWRDMYSTIYVEKYLYDLDKDPHELVNMIMDTKYVDVKTNLRERLIQLVGETEDNKPIIITLE